MLCFQICNKLLNLDSSDATAFHCKVVALVQGGRFQDCLKQLESNKFPELELSFETAYCHYRLNDPVQALAILDSLPNPAVKHNELRAQVRRSS